jgi:AraC-like DNA-binding protein
VKTELAAIRRLVGPATKEQLRYIDCFVAGEVALFMPVGGACFYALTPEHTHPSYMFILHFNDQTAVKLDGRVSIGKPGTVFALSPGVPHQELPSETPPRYICVLIAKRSFEKQFALYSRRKPPLFMGESFGADRGFVQLLKRFMIEADNRMPGAQAVLSALGVEICHALIRAAVKAPLPKDRMTDRVEVNRAIEYLHSHLDGKITVDVLADAAHLSTSHFARVFREETGKSPMEYVLRLRLERSKKLLLAGDKIMSEIALDCGFGSSSYLSSCFLKHYRMTPSEYRKGIKKG